MIQFAPVTFSLVSPVNRLAKLAFFTTFLEGATMSTATTATAKKSRKSAAAAAAAAAAIAPAVPEINPHEIASLVKQAEELRERGKELYAASDDCNRKIMQAIGIGKSLVLPNGLILRVVDNFKNADGTPREKAVGIAMVSQYSVKVAKS